MLGIFEIIGAIGVVLITLGVLNQKKKIEDIYFITGGILLATYSFYLKNTIFIILQTIFTIAAIYDLVKISK